MEEKKNRRRGKTCEGLALKRCVESDRFRMDVYVCVLVFYAYKSACDRGSRVFERSRLTTLADHIDRYN